MEETISLKELLQAIRKRFRLIAVITLIAVTVSGVVSYFFLTPIYEASTQILVNQRKSADQMYNTGDLQTNLQLINTYSVIIQSPTILDKVREELELEEIGEVTVESEKNSQVVSITVHDPDPVKAVEVANTIATIFKTEIITIMSVDNVSILSKAEVAEEPNPIKPHPLLNMAIAFALGLMLGIGVAFLLDHLDNTIKSEEDIRNFLDLPILGTVTVITEKQEKKRAVAKQTRELGGESVGS